MIIHRPARKQALEPVKKIEEPVIIKEPEFSIEIENDEEEEIIIPRYNKRVKKEN